MSRTFLWHYCESWMTIFSVVLSLHYAIHRIRSLRLFYATRLCKQTIMSTFVSHFVRLWLEMNMSGWRWARAARFDRLVVKAFDLVTPHHHLCWCWHSLEARVWWRLLPPARWMPYAEYNLHLFIKGCNTTAEITHPCSAGWGISASLPDCLGEILQIAGGGCLFRFVVLRTTEMFCLDFVSHIS